MTGSLQKVLDAINCIEEKKDDKFYAQIKNALRIYYLGLDSIFIADRILKNVDLSNLGINNDEKPHIENAGWLLDQEYVNDVYVGALKTNLILDAWLVFNGNPRNVTSEDDKNFLEWYEVLVDSLNHDLKGTVDKEIELADGETLLIVKDQVVDIITPNVVLSLVNKLIDVYKTA